MRANLKLVKPAPTPVSYTEAGPQRRRQAARVPDAEEGREAHQGRPRAGTPPQIGGNAVPERAQLVDACFWRIPGNQGAVNGADRDAADPVGIDLGLR
jgi:hypothetical protein